MPIKLIPRTLAIILLCSAPCLATTFYVRNDGGTSAQCLGTTDAAYDGSGTGEACAYASTADAITASACGDTIKAKAGHTFDGTVTLPNKSCSVSTPITLTTTAALPARRMGPANTVADTITDSALMPRFRTLGGGTIGATFEYATGASWWILDGLEITDNSPNNIAPQAFIDATSHQPINNITIQRCWIHQKETGTNYNRAVQRGVYFNGSGLTMKWNYIHLKGYYRTEITGGDAFQQMDTTSMLSEIGPGPITMTDNFISVWWNGYFLGGADSAPQNTATVSSATTSSATFSNTTGLSAGVVIRMEAYGTVHIDMNDHLCSGANTNGYRCTYSDRLTGITLTSQEMTNNGYSGRPGVLTGTANRRFLVWNADGDGVDDEITQNGTNPPGDYNMQLFMTVMVDSVVGSTVNYHPYSSDAMGSNLAPSVTTASWNYGDQGLINDVTITKNTFMPDAAFCIDVFTRKGYTPKGIFEIKNVNRFLYEGNYHTGYPAVMGFTPANQNGGAPWITTSNITIRSNYVHPTDGNAGNGGLGYDGRNIIISNDAYLQTDTPNRNIEVSNNLFTNVRMLGNIKDGDGVVFKHNTVANLTGTVTGNNSILMDNAEVTTGFVFRDNIASHVLYGVQCIGVGGGTIPDCFPSGILSNNVISDDNSAGFSVGTFGALSPIPPSLTAIFVNYGTGNLRLPGGSPYHNSGSDGTDPGCDWPALITALGFDPSGVQGTASTSVSGKVTFSGKVVIN